MRKSMCLLAFLAIASMSMATIAPVASVTVDYVPGVYDPTILPGNTNPIGWKPPSNYWLKSITVGGYTVKGMITGTSNVFDTLGNPVLKPNMDDFDLNTLVSRNANSGACNTVLFGGTNFVSTNGSLPDFFLFEGAGSGNPDDVSIAPIFTDGSIGLGIALPTNIEPTVIPGWGDTGLKIEHNTQNGNWIVGVAFDITDLLDGNGNNLSSSAVIKGISILNGPGLDPCGFYAVPEPATLFLFAVGGLLAAKCRKK